MALPELEQSLREVPHPLAAEGSATKQKISKSGLIGVRIQTEKM